MGTPGITVIDVFRELGLEPEKEKTWVVGQMVVQRYKRQYGELPPKDLRTKTCGEGVHCFAIYPETFRETIKDCIGQIQTDQARQQGMF